MTISISKWTATALSGMVFATGALSTVSLANPPQRSWANSAVAMTAYIHAHQGTSGFAFSPESLRRVLLLLNDGAEGATKEELSRFLGPTSADKPSTDAGDEAMLATGVFVRKPLRIAEQFKAIVESNHEANVLSVDAADGGRVINAWVTKNTRGKIHRIIDSDRLTADLVAVNTLYFKGRWQHHFDPKLTQNGPFFGSAGQSDAAFMRLDEHFAYKADENLKAVALPYAGGRYALEILMPLEGGAFTVSRLLSEPHRWPDLHNIPPRHGYIEIPRFDIESRFELNRALAATGLEIPFDPIRADFTSMTAQRSKLFVGRVIQKVKLSVDEEGMTAAAATAAVMIGGLAPESEFNFVANRPFVFVLRRIADNAMLFVGAFDPSTK